MMNEDIIKLQYPIGKFEKSESITSEQIQFWINEIEELPAKLQKVISELNENQLDTPYRPGGWTVRQVVHHLADSHVNSFCRFRLALTESTPAIKPYFEDRWAELIDARTAPVELSINLLTALHARWVILLRSLTSAEFSKTFYHPEHEKEFRLDVNIGIYAWHGKHHLAHIQSLTHQNQ